MVRAVLEFKKGDLVWVSLVVVLLCVGLGVAYNSGVDPSVMGHSAEELAFDSGMVMGGSNSWILHTPDDGRTTLYIAPGVNGESWDWTNQTSIENNGNVRIQGDLEVTGSINGADFSEICYCIQCKSASGRVGPERCASFGSYTDYSIMSSSTTYEDGCRVKLYSC